MPAAAQDTSTDLVRGAKLDAMVREILEWLNERTEYFVSSAPEIIFLDNFDIAIAEYEHKRGAWRRPGRGHMMSAIGSEGPIATIQRQ